MERIVLVIGATGKQGGAVARHLAGKGLGLRALTRSPGSPAAKSLASLGVDVLQGDLDDAESLSRALEGVWGVFAMSTMVQGVAREEEQGKRLAAVARIKGVRHFVFSSVASANHRTGIPHFESKARIEESVRALRFPSWAILRPVFFMENLLTPWSLKGDKLVYALSPATVVQMVAVEDIGRFGAMLVEKGERVSGTELDIAGDALTLPRAAEVLSEVRGSKIEFVQGSIDAVRQANPDLATMFEWFERAGYRVDVAALERTWGIKPLSFTEWARQLARAP